VKKVIKIIECFGQFFSYQLALNSTSELDSGKITRKFLYINLRERCCLGNICYGCAVKDKSYVTRGDGYWDCNFMV
jgi:hypothetical protein